jgi:hypothetical protein
MTALVRLIWVAGAGKAAAPAGRRTELSTAEVA